MIWICSTWVNWTIKELKTVKGCLKMIALILYKIIGFFLIIGFLSGWFGCWPQSLKKPYLKKFLNVNLKPK